MVWADPILLVVTRRAVWDIRTSITRRRPFLTSWNIGWGDVLTLTVNEAWSLHRQMIRTLRKEAKAMEGK